MIGRPRKSKMNEASVSTSQLKTSANMSLTIQNLPDEILRMVFEYLTFPEKMIIRLVDRRWNEQVTPSFVEQATYTYHTDRHFYAKSRQVFLDSTTPWKSLKFYDPQHLILPTLVKTRIKTLKLVVQQPNFNWQTLRFIQKFPNLKNLSLCVYWCGIPMENNSNQNFFDDDFSGFCKTLSSLSFNFPYNDYRQLEQFLKILSKGETLNLIELELIEDPDDPHDPFENHDVPDPTTFPFEHITNIVSKSASQLKTFRFEYHSDFIKHRYAPELLNKLKDIKELQLTEIWISTDFEIPVTETNFLIHQAFLKSQKKSLVGFTLPYIGNAEVCRKLLQNIVADPKTIKELEFLRADHLEHLPLNFSEEFSGLKSMSVMLKRSSEIFNGPCPSISKLEVYLVRNTGNHNHQVVLFKHLADTMVNLSELILYESHHRQPCSYTNSDLQLIIKEFPKLRVLKINRGRDITDHGVSGNRSLYEIVRTRELFMNSTGTEVVPVTGVPISSLKNLEELEILDSGITDAGIFFGFRFGPSSSLRRLKLESRNKDVSSWGLHWLGTFNPQLQSFTGIFRFERISSTAKESLKNMFPLTQHNKKFELHTKEREDFEDEWWF